MEAYPITTDEPCELCDKVASDYLIQGKLLTAECVPWFGPRGCRRLMVCRDCLPRVIDLETSSDELPSWLQS